MPVRIGELLLKERRITPEQLQEALNYQKLNGGKLGFNLVKLGVVRDEEITGLLSKQYGVPSINLSQFEIDPSVIKLIPAETAQKYQIVPLSRAGATLSIAMTDPTNVFAMDDIKFMTGYNVEPVVASETAVIEAIQKYYATARPVVTGGPSALDAATRALEEMPTAADADVEILDDMEEINVEALMRQGEEAPIIRLVNVLLMSAIHKGASDIHIEPYEKELRVRYRVDGVLYNIMNPPMKFRDAISSRVKIMAKLDIAEKRLPQDGQRPVEGNRLPRVGAAHAVRREDRHAAAGPRQADAGHDQARLRSGRACPVRVGHPEAVGHGAGHGPDRQRQDQHAVLRDLAHQYA
jgi:type IV pilus assembly protein PilB